MISCELKGALFGVIIKEYQRIDLVSWGMTWVWGTNPSNYPEDANELREALQYIEAPSALVI